MSFELGGKNAGIVFADADFDKAVAGVTRSAFGKRGQVCLGTERVYVQRPIFDRFVAALKEKTESLKIGPPEQESVNLGPLTSVEPTIWTGLPERASVERKEIEIFGPCCYSARFDTNKRR